MVTPLQWARKVLSRLFTIHAGKFRAGRKSLSHGDKLLLVIYTQVLLVLLGGSNYPEKMTSNTNAAEWQSRLYPGNYCRPVALAKLRRKPTRTWSDKVRLFSPAAASFDIFVGCGK
ncbi:MAG: hypothetical protein AAF702_16380 [Chloroflexota bacterium]